MQKGMTSFGILHCVWLSIINFNVGCDILPTVKWSTNTALAISLEREWIKDPHTHQFLKILSVKYMNPITCDGQDFDHIYSYKNNSGGGGTRSFDVGFADNNDMDNSFWRKCFV